MFDELRRASAGGVADYAGISYERIAAEDGVFWPCPDDGHAGTPRLFLDRFPTPDGKARFHAVHHRPAAEEPDQYYPLWLTTGRVLSQYQSGAQTRRVAALNEAEPEPFVEIHPEMARNFGIRAGQGPADHPARRRGPQGASRPDHPDGHAVRPLPLGRQGLRQPADQRRPRPRLKIPEFKACAVRVEPMPVHEPSTARQ